MIWFDGVTLAFHMDSIIAAETAPDYSDGELQQHTYQGMKSAGICWAKIKFNGVNITIFCEWPHIRIYLLEWNNGSMVGYPNL